MNSPDDQLERLLKAAAQAPARIVDNAPFGLETRVLAAWREGRAGFWSPVFLLRGLLLALVVMLASLLPLAEKSASANPASDYLQLADSTVQLGDKL